MNTKQCTKCNIEFAATLEFFYKNKGGKYGLTPRCKPCVNADNKSSLEKRLLSDPEAVKKMNNAKAKRFYENNSERVREIQRVSAAKRREDPVTRALINARKRANGAGLTPQEIDTIRKTQNNLCAICDSPNPTDLDHCHKSGKVRWLLCMHCNRGLGAFRDNPTWLSKAAKLLNEIN